MKKLGYLLLIFIGSCGTDGINDSAKYTNQFIFEKMLTLMLSDKQECLPDGKDDKGTEYDVGDRCSTAKRATTIGDNCAGLPNQTSVKGTLDGNDIDLYLFKFVDSSSLFCDVWSDSFYPTLSLVSAPPGVVLCVTLESDLSCHERTRDFSPEKCSLTRWSSRTNYGSDNTLVLSAWVRWHPQAPKQCASYELAAQAALN